MKKPTRGQQIAEKMVRIEKHDALGGIELQIGNEVICWEVEGVGKLPKDAESIKRYIAYKIDTAYQEGRRSGEWAERELSVRGKRTTLEEVKALKKTCGDFAAFVKGVGQFLAKLDAEMRTPSSVERGRRIAKLCNALDMMKQRAEYFAPGIKNRRKPTPSPAPSPSADAAGNPAAATGEGKTHPSPGTNAP